MSSCPLGLQLSLRSNADPSGTFCPNSVRTKRRENEPFSLTKMQANASIFYPFLPRLCCHNKYRLTKADSTIESPPSQLNCNEKQTAKSQKKQAILVCFFFILFARCILISYSVNLISSNPNSTSNL